MQKFTLLIGFIFILISSGQTKAQSSDENVKIAKI